MIVFVDLRFSGLSGYRFSYWDKIRDKFIEISGECAWDSFEDFEYDLIRHNRQSDRGNTIWVVDRFRTVTPEWAMHPELESAHDPPGEKEATEEKKTYH